MSKVQHGEKNRQLRHAAKYLLCTSNSRKTTEMLKKCSKSSAVTFLILILQTFDIPQIKGYDMHDSIKVENLNFNVVHLLKSAVEKNVPAKIFLLYILGYSI